jgi:hypothetical protein
MPAQHLGATRRCVWYALTGVAADLDWSVLAATSMVTRCYDGGERGGVVNGRVMVDGGHA